MGAWEHAGTIRNVYSFAHAKYGGDPWPERLLRNQNTCSFSFCTFTDLGVEGPRGGAILLLCWANGSPARAITDVMYVRV